MLCDLAFLTYVLHVLHSVPSDYRLNHLAIHSRRHILRSSQLGCLYGDNR